MSLSEFDAGIFLVDKPSGPTSFWMVRQVRRLLGIKKVGHAGTLDPFASGLLIICAGRPATKMISSFMDGEKEYLATLCLGVQTETLDPEGEVLARRSVGLKSGLEIEQCLSRFRGEQLQTPPAYSALKHNGKPLYYYARKGIEVKKDPRPVNIKTLQRLDGSGDIEGEEILLPLRVVCSKGTYIRTLAADIGEQLGCGAYLKELRRVRSGQFSIEKSIEGKELSLPDGRERLLQAMLSVDEVCNLLQ